MECGDENIVYSVAIKYDGESNSYWLFIYERQINDIDIMHFIKHHKPLLEMRPLDYVLILWLNILEVIHLGMLRVWANNFEEHQEDRLTRLPLPSSSVIIAVLVDFRYGYVCYES